MVAAGCLDAGTGGEAGDEEVARVARPTGSVEAVVQEVPGGATASLLYTVHVMSTGGRATEDNRVAVFSGATRNDSAWGVTLRWAGTDSLRIEYLRARVAQLQRPMLSIGDLRVHVVLDSGVADPNAPSGGMLWNLRGRPPAAGAEAADTGSPRSGPSRAEP